MTARQPDDDRGSLVGRILRTILWALVVAFAIGFVIGTLLRRELEKPVRYVGGLEVGPSVAARPPRHVVYARTGVLVARDHEEQVG
jgi:hypothetical protein